MKNFIIFITAIIFAIGAVSCTKNKTMNCTFEFDTEFAENALMQDLMKEVDSDPLTLAFGGAFVKPMVKSLYNTIEFKKDGTAIMRDATNNVLLNATYRIEKDSLYFGDGRFGFANNELTMTDNGISFRYKLKE